MRPLESVTEAQWLVLVVVTPYVPLAANDKLQATLRQLLIMNAWFGFTSSTACLLLAGERRRPRRLRSGRGGRAGGRRSRLAGRPVRRSRRYEAPRCCLLTLLFALDCYLSLHSGPRSLAAMQWLP